MRGAERRWPRLALVVVLRVVGLVDLLAFWAVVAPHEQLSRIQSWIGMGPLAEGPVTEYLARTTSLFYVASGLLFWVLSTDVARYRPVIRFVGLVGVIGGGLIAWIDISAGLPGWWIALEGPCCIVLGGVILGLQAADRGDV
jgi:hypothetical protein